MKVTITGATGLIGRRLVRALELRGDEVAVLSRDAKSASQQLGVEAFDWDPRRGLAPSSGLSGRDGVVHLAGESVAQRWSPKTKRRIKESRVVGTQNLVGGLREADNPPRVLISSSAVGYYGPRGDEVVQESEPQGRGFLCEVCADWEREAIVAEALGIRVVRLRTGIVLDRSGGALKQMLGPFKAGLGGPIAGGNHFMPWIHVDDVVAMTLSALDSAQWVGPFNATAPTPATNKEFTKSLGRALGRPAVAPIPAIALKALYGEMSEILTTGQNAQPAAALGLGHEFAHTDLDEALKAALSLS